MLLQTVPPNRADSLIAENDERLLPVIFQNREQKKLVRVDVVSGLTKTQAEQLLDWLENQDCIGLAITMEADSFSLRCVCPPGMRLSADEGRGVFLSSQSSEGRSARLACA